MILRIVRMEFEPEKLNTFLDVFHESMEQIRNFPGCQRLELHRDAHDHHVLFTVSEWTDEAALEQYRLSPLFSATWARTKVLFQGKPMAFSLENLVQVKEAPKSDAKA